MKLFKPIILISPATAALVLFLDQTSKRLVMAQLVEGQSWDAVPELALFRITHVTNTGAAFGLFPHLSNLFILVALFVIGAIIFYLQHLPDEQWLARIALGLQLGGATGNLVDRLHWGSVVDFIDLNFWPLQKWPVFNLADTSIVTGVTLLVLLMLWEEWCARDELSASEGGGKQASAR